MGIFDELKKLTHPYDDEDEEYEDFEEPRERSFEDRRNKAEDRRNKVVNIHATTQLKVVLVKPDRFENASEIADQLKDKRTVVLWRHSPAGKHRKPETLYEKPPALPEVFLLLAPGRGIC